ITLQAAVNFEEYYRCYCIGKKYVHIMPYEPRNPHHLRYEASFTLTPARKKELEEYCLRICNALSYDFNTIEFAVENGVPYAIDYMNPAPDAEKGSVGDANFEWVVETTAKYLVECAHAGRAVPKEYAWSEFINGAPEPKKSRTASASRKTKK
ncbi:MAG: hypothetical protein ACKOAX_01995, partial [Candidatus Kapaibacterium sp.]